MTISSSKGKNCIAGSDLAPANVMRFAALVVFTGTLLTVAPSRAQAQPQFIKDNVAKMVRKVGVHLNTSFRNPVDSDVTKGRTFGVSIGLSPGNTNGWRYPIGLTMFSENLHSPNGQPFAELRSRAIMAGIGYGWHFGRLSTGASLQGGFAVNHAATQGDALSAFGVSEGVVSAHAANSPLLRPQIKAEYFITPKFTFRVSADYMWLRPAITATTPAGVIADRWNPSNFHANIGFGVYPFRK